MYHQLGSQIAQHETEIHGLRHKQALVIGLMHEQDMPYRTLAPMLGMSKSRVQQLAESTVLRKERANGSP